MRPPYYKAHLALFFVNVLYGAGHIIAKGVMPEFLTPAVFIFLRVSGAVVFFGYWPCCIINIKSN